MCKAGVPDIIRSTPGGTRTRNLRIRGPTPCPLGHGGNEDSCDVVVFTQPKWLNIGCAPGPLAQKKRSKSKPNYYDCCRCAFERTPVELNKHYHYYLVVVVVVAITVVVLAPLSPIPIVAYPSFARRRRRHRRCVVVVFVY